jgi:hypothetical protein
MVQYMGQKGMIADLIMINDPKYRISYATTDPYNPAQADLRYFRYILARYAAYPNVIWCQTNEWQLYPTDLNYGVPNKPDADAWDPYWNAIGNLVKNEDPWMEDSGKKRALSTHGYNRELFDDEAGYYTEPVYYYVFKPAYLSWATFSITEWGVHLYDDWAAQRGGLKPLESNMPAVNDESMYVGWVSWSGSHFNSTRNRLYTWATYVAGGYFTIGDAFDSNGNNADEGTLDKWNWGPIGWSSGDYYYGKDMKKAYDEMKIFTDFFNTTKYWKMKEHNELVPGYSNFNRVYTLADPGDEYVVYSAAGNSFDINLEPGLYSVVLFDPRTGTSIEQGVVNGSVYRRANSTDDLWRRSVWISRNRDL